MKIFNSYLTIICHLKVPRKTENICNKIKILDLQGGVKSNDTPFFIKHI